MASQGPPNTTPPQQHYPFAPVHSTPTAPASVTPSQASTNTSSAAVTRTTLEKNVNEGTLLPDQFRDYLLAKPPRTAYNGLAGQHQSNVNEIMAATRTEKPAYEPLARILSEMSEKIWTERNPSREAGTFIKIFPTYKVPKGEVETKKTTPDLFSMMLEGPDSDLPKILCWGESKFFGEVKRKGGHSYKPWQPLSYGRNVSMANVAVTGQLYIGADPTGFYLFAQNPSTFIYSSPQYRWDEPESINVLFDLVYTLYNPLDHFPLTDPLFKPRTTSKGTAWEVEYLPGKTSTFQMIRSFPGPGRQTCVLQEVFANPPVTHEGQHVDPLPAANSTLLLKRVFRDPRRRFKEEALYDIIHERGGFIPSLAHFIGTLGTAPTAGLKVGLWPEGFSQPTFAKPAQVIERERIIQVFDSFGDPLSSCKSVLQLLKVLFDAMQAHREMWLRHILHCDISDNNILVNPKHGALEGRQTRSGRTYKLINQVLQSNEPKVEGMLIDLDNAADVRVTIPFSPGTAWTGTHKFIAISVLNGGWKLPSTYHPTAKVLMPPLVGQARELYKQAWSEEVYLNWTGAVKGPETIHEGDLDPEHLPAFTHLPYHDMESKFWVTYWSLLLAVPQGAKDREDCESHPVFQAAYRIVATHGAGLSDSRDKLHQQPWATHLHSGLRSLGQMLKMMWEYVSVEWGLFYHIDGTTPQDHVHEAVMRLLLQEIVRLQAHPIPIDMGVRCPRRKETPGAANASPSKKPRTS